MNKMASNAKYALWLQKAVEDSDLIEELKRISGDEKEIYDRFYKELEFGTAGLRGVIGAGTNRMNIYTVRRTTQGLANYLNSKKEGASVAIAYDSRLKSERQRVRPGAGRQRHNRQNREGASAGAGSVLRRAGAPLRRRYYDYRQP